MLDGLLEREPRRRGGLGCFAMAHLSHAQRGPGSENGDCGLRYVVSLVAVVVVIGNGGGDGGLMVG